MTGDDNEPGEAAEEAMMDPDDDGDVYPDRGNNAKLQVEIHNGPVFSVVISPDGKLAATGDGDDKAFVWDLATGEVVFELTGHEDSVTALAFSSSGEYLASGDMEGEIRYCLTTMYQYCLHLRRIWSVEKQELVTELSCADDLTVRTQYTLCCPNRSLVVFELASQGQISYRGDCIRSCTHVECSQWDFILFCWPYGTSFAHILVKLILPKGTSLSRCLGSRW